MICSDCYNAIIRVINNPQEETFTVCTLDGKLMSPALLRCNKYEQPVFKPEVKEVAQPKVFKKKW